MTESTKKVIQEICEEENIHWKELSLGYIQQLEKEGEYRFLLGSEFDLNTQASANIMTDKFATEQVLKENKIPVMEYEILFNPKVRKDFTDPQKTENQVKDFIRKNGKSVIKPNNGENGDLVELCCTEEEAVSHVEKIFQKDTAACLSVFYDIEAEYRCVYLEGEILLVFQKIPQEGEWRHNLQFGAIPQFLQDEKRLQELKELAIKAAKAVNARFVSVDIVRASNPKDSEKRDYIIEINSCVCLAKFAQRIENGEAIRKEIYRKAILELWR